MRNKLFKPIHPSWCFYGVVWGVIVGLIFGVITERVLVAEIWMLVIAIIGCFICLRQACIFTMILAILSGLTIGNFRINAQLAGREVLATLQNQQILLTGRLSDDPDKSKSAMVVKLKDLRVLLSGSSTSFNNSENTVSELIAQANPIKISGTMYVTIADQAELERSDIVVLEGKLSEGFGTYVGKIYRAKLVAAERAGVGDIFARFKREFAQKVSEFIPSPEVELGMGYLMGMKSGLPEDFVEALQAVGMTHVVVASGAHLAILIDAAKKLFGKVSKFAGIMAALLMIMVFVFIVGFTPSMTRAALVSSLSLIVGYVGRKFTSLRLIAFVAMTTLLLDPTFLLNLGWQLSFASFFGILVLAPRIVKVLYGGKKPPWLASMLTTSIATSLVCAPILFYNFGSLSLLALVANLIILPTLPYVMMLMLLTGVTSFWPVIARIITFPTTWLLDLHIWVVNFLSEQTAFIITVPAEDARIYMLYVPVLIFLAYPTHRKVLRKRHASDAKPLESLPTQ